MGGYVLHNLPSVQRNYIQAFLIDIESIIQIHGLPVK